MSDGAEPPANGDAATGGYVDHYPLNPDVDQ